MAKSTIKVIFPTKIYPCKICGQMPIAEYVDAWENVRITCSGFGKKHGAFITNGINAAFQVWNRHQLEYDDDE